jgi:predicted O-linked N-acetylglucosamine transferase (SPINDLY family)
MTRTHKGGADPLQEIVNRNYKNKQPVNFNADLKHIIEEAEKQEIKRIKEQIYMIQNTKYNKKWLNNSRHSSLELKKILQELQKDVNETKQAIINKKSTQYSQSWLNSNPPLWLLKKALKELTSTPEKIITGGKGNTRKHMTRKRKTIRK